MSPEAIAQRFNKYGSGATRPDCILWTGDLAGTGYPILYSTTDRTVYAHRWVWEQANGPLGDLTIDHLCHVRCCVALAHLEAVTMAENCERMRARKTHCKYGHPFDAVNKHGWRFCRTCKRGQQTAAYRRKNPGSAPLGQATHCPKGHEYTPENLVPRADTPQHRRCRICHTAAIKRRTAREKEQRRVRREQAA